MLISGLHKIYISTRRDFSGFLGQEVTMEADGSLSAFVFLGFKETGSTAGAVTGGEVKVSGRLEASDNATLGNYLILTDTAKIYLKSVRDYSAWIGSEVELTARGTLQSFTEARLSKK